jgi:UDP-N-acetyl-D-mannosaminuronate dehydrogenase
MAQRMSETAREINDLQPSRQLARVAAGWRSLAGERVHLLGLGFRPGVKVDSLSPAYTLQQESRRLGASVTLEDPLYTGTEIRQAGFTPGTPADAKLVILNTAHEEFSRPNFVEWRASGVEAVLDGRNLWDQSVVEHAGLLYFGIGRSSRTEVEGSPRRAVPVS